MYVIFDYNYINCDRFIITNKQTNKQQTLTKRYKGSYITSLIANLLESLLVQANCPIIFLYKKRKQEYA